MVRATATGRDRGSSTGWRSCPRRFRPRPWPPPPTAPPRGVARLSLALEPNAVVDAPPAPLHRTGTTLAASLNLIPGISRSLTSVREAQTMRGWRPRGLRSFSEILVPVTLTALENSIQLAETMEARGYGSGPRTRMSRPRLHGVDALTLACASISVLAFIAGRWSGAVADWYPDPSPTWPAGEAVMVAARLLPALPAGTRRHD